MQRLEQSEKKQRPAPLIPAKPQVKTLGMYREPHSLAHR